MKAIESERLFLRQLAGEDAGEIIRIHSIPEVSRYQGWVPETEPEIRSFIERMVKDEFLAPDQWFQFAIFSKLGGRLIGDCGVHAGAKDRRQVEVGITIDPEFQNEGFGYKAIKALLDHVFRETETHRVYASIDPRNEPSIRLFEKLGFRKEAHLVESLWFKGEWADDLIMGILRNEWARPRAV